MALKRSPRLKGLADAPEYWVDGLHDIQFHGTNTLFVPCKIVRSASGIYYQVPFVVRCRTGAIAKMSRQIMEFAREHRLKDQDDTR